MTKPTMTRRGLLRAFAATTVTAAPFAANATGLLRGAGDIRKLKMYASRTGEALEMVYWIEGEYIRPAIEEISYLMRDWRTDETRDIDPVALDILAATHNLVDTNEPYMLLSGYRSAATNAMLRRRSSGVARNSLHIPGKAADIRLSSRSVSQVARAAQSIGAGGVGRYSRSNFTHMDSGDVRTWGG